MMGTREDRFNDYMVEKWHTLVESRVRSPTIPIGGTEFVWKIGLTCDNDWVCINCLDEYNETERGDGPWGHINPNNPDTFMKILAKDSVDEYPKCCKCGVIFTYMKLEGQ